MKIVSGQGSAVDDFMGHLFKLLGYDEPDRIVRRRVVVHVRTQGAY